MNKQDKLDKIFMNVAIEFSDLAHCACLKVGAVAVKDNRIIATGINGTPAGMKNCDKVFKPFSFSDNVERERHHEWSSAHEIHAEMNIIIFCAKNGIELDGTTLYTTVQPCQYCMKNLLQTGVKRIVYKYPYDKSVASKLIEDYLKERNIILEQIKE